MRHGVKKIKFSKGQDAHQALMRKLVLNFIKHGRTEVTLTKAKALKSVVDRLTAKAIRGEPSDKQVLMRYLSHKHAIRAMTDEVVPVMKGRTGGYVSLVKLGPRQGDFAEMVRVEWIEKLQKVQQAEPVKDTQKSTPPAKSVKRVKAL